jgi:hypothetical protein
MRYNPIYIYLLALLMTKRYDKDVDQIELPEMIRTLNDHAMQAEKNLKEEQEEIEALKELDDLDEDPNMVKLSLQQVGTSAFRTKCYSLGLPLIVYTNPLMGYQRIGMYLEMNQEYINPNDIYYLLFRNLDDTLTRLTKLTRYTQLGIMNTLLLVSDIAKEYENIPTPCVLGDPDNLQKSELTLDKLSEIVNHDTRNTLLRKYLIYSRFSTSWREAEEDFVKNPAALVEHVGTSAFTAKCKSLNMSKFLYADALGGYQRIGAHLERFQVYINPNDIYYLLFFNFDDTLTRLTKLTRYTESVIINKLLIASDTALEDLHFPKYSRMWDLDNQYSDTEWLGSELTLDRLAKVATFSAKRNLLSRYLIYSRFTDNWEFMQVADWSL